MNRFVSTIVIVIGVGLFLAYQAIFIVNQTEQALVLQFGDIRKVVKEPGLNFKIPFIQNVVYFDKRLLMFDVPAREINAKDEKLNITERLVIDAYVIYRISDPLQFYQAVRSEQGLETQLASIADSSLRKTIGSASLRDLLSEKRSVIMAEIRDAINRKASSLKVEIPTVEGEEVAAEQKPVVKRGFGIEVVDVRIKRADLPVEVSQSTFERMRSDFEKEAQKFRAEGEERSLKIRSGAERERAELIAEAMRKAEEIRGEGDGVATKTYADAFSKDPEFFDFYRSMQAYKKSMQSGDETTVILSPKSDFLKYME